MDAEVDALDAAVDEEFYLQRWIGQRDDDVGVRGRWGSCALGG